MEILSSTPKKEIYPEKELKEFLEKENLLKHFSEKDLELLKRGQYTQLIENVQRNGTVADYKFVLGEHSDGTFKIHPVKKKIEIDLPEQILGTKLTPEDHKNLLKGDMVGPFIVGDNKMFFRFDKQLNTITLHSPKSLGVPEHINELPNKTGFGKYEFTDHEQNQIANGKGVGPKVYCADGKWFLGTYSREEKQTEFVSKVFIHKELSERQAKKLMPLYNNIVYHESSANIDLIQKQAFFIPESPFKANSSLKNTTGDHLPQFANKSYSIDKNGIKLDYNDSFGYLALIIDKKNGIPNEIFKNSFSTKDIEDLKNGKVLENKDFIFKNGDKVNANVQLIEDGDKIQLVFKINSILEKDKTKAIEAVNPYPLMKYSAEDKLVMDLVDRKDLKGLNKVIDSGYKPSQDIQRLIYSNPTVGNKLKMEIATIFKTDPSLVNSLHNKQPLSANNKESDIKLAPLSDLPTNKIPSADKIKGKEKGNKHHILNGIKNIFSDM